MNTAYLFGESTAVWPFCVPSSAVTVGVGRVGLRLPCTAVCVVTAEVARPESLAQWQAITDRLHVCDSGWTDEDREEVRQRFPQATWHHAYPFDYLRCGHLLAVHVALTMGATDLRLVNYTKAWTHPNHPDGEVRGAMQAWSADLSPARQIWELL